MRNIVTTLLLSQGVPMIRSGDELSQTQHGNNNAYCQDNELSWLSWNLDPEQKDFLRFVKRVIRLWKRNPIFQRRKFFQGRGVRGRHATDITWLTPSGDPMSDHDWNEPHARCLGVRLEGNLLDEVDQRGRPIASDTFLLLLNAHHHPVEFTLPPHLENEFWRPAIDTSGHQPPSRVMSAQQIYCVEGHAMVVLRLQSMPSKLAARLLRWGQPEIARTAPHFPVGARQADTAARGLEDQSTMPPGGADDTEETPLRIEVSGGATAERDSAETSRQSTAVETAEANSRDLPSASAKTSGSESAAEVSGARSATKK